MADNDSNVPAVMTTAPGAAAAAVGNFAAHVDSMIGKIGGFIEGLALAPIASRETEVIPLGGEIGTGELQLLPREPAPGWDEDLAELEEEKL